MPLQTSSSRRRSPATSAGNKRPRRSARAAAATSHRAAPPGPPSPRPIGKYERLAYERHERDLRAAYGKRWSDPTIYGDPTLTRHPKGFYFDPAAGERVVLFIEGFCRHFEAEWAGEPIKLEEWQRFILRVAFGWMRADGTRRFRIVYLEIPRKNGKSLKASGVGNYLAFADYENGAQVYATATKEAQAKIVWDGGREMVRRSPALRRFIRIRQKRLSCERLGSFFAPLGADSDTLDGLNAHGHITDELHKHKDRGVWDVMLTSMGVRRQPMTFAITTAGVYDPASIGWEQHEHATKVLDQVLEDDEFFAMIFAADKGDRIFNPATWAKANPNLGVSVKLSFLEELANKAKAQPSFLNTFKRLHLNIWTQQLETWIPIEKWNACDRRPLTPDDLRGRSCCAAVDLSSRDDITALALAFDPAEPDGIWDFVWRFYVPEELVRVRARENRQPDYSAWVRDGWLTTTPGDVIDYEFIKRDIKELADVASITEIGYDPWNATQFALGLEEDGFQCVEMRQGPPTLSEPCKEFEKLVVARRIRHGGNPVMLWMISNAAIRRDANLNIAPDKKHAKGKIDGVSASVMALGRAILQPAQEDWRPV